MKILELSPTLLPGGAERFTVDLTNELAKTNDVTLFVLRKFRNSDFYRNEISSKVKYIEWHGSLSKISKLLQLFKVLFFVIKLKPDIVHAHTVGINWLLLPSLLYPRAKYYFTIHNLADQECTTKLGFIIRNFLFRRNVRAITISDICEQSFQTFFGFFSFEKIDNGCRNLYVSNKLQDVEKEINAFKVDDKTKVFLNIARIMPQKNHQLLINSFNKFVEKGYNSILLIIGDYKCFPNLKKELDSIVKTDRIHFLGTRDNVSDYLYISDYFCLSSAWEGLPISLLEAGLLGCYPISTPAGGVVDIIKNNKWGILSTDFSQESFLEALINAYKTKYDRSEIVNLYKNKYSMKICAEKYINAFMK